VLVLLAPRSVFAALRDDSDEAAEARQDVAGGLVWLAGISGILATTVASTLLDDVEIDGSLAAVWAFLAGGLYGFFLYYVVGKVLARRAAQARQPRQLPPRAPRARVRRAPIALALFVYWPFRIAVYGDDLFRTGGPTARRRRRHGLALLRLRRVGGRAARDRRAHRARVDVGALRRRRRASRRDRRGASRRGERALRPR
jgi:hypothetical protein